MPLDPTYHDHVLELLAPIDGITTGRMFGGVSFRHDRTMFGFIDKNSTLYFKVDDSNRDAYVAAGSTALGNGRMTMPYYEVPAEVLEDPAACLEWAHAAIAAGHATAKAKKRGPKK